MKFQIRTKIVGDPDSKSWIEDYNKETKNPQEWAKETIKRFNGSLRGFEKARVLLDVIVLGDEDNVELHDWFKRTDGMSESFRGSIVDIMECRKCRIKGKRYGLGTQVIRDSKYKAKAFNKCNTGIELLKKRANKETVE